MYIEGLRNKLKALPRLFICQRCNYLYIDLDAPKGNCPCKKCGYIINAARIQAETNYRQKINTITSSMVELYALNPNAYSIKPNIPSISPEAEFAIHLSIIIFFCGLAEVLLEEFLAKLMDKKDISKEDQQKYLEKYRDIGKRVTKLFSELLDISWNEAIKEIETKQPNNTSLFSDSIEFYNKANKIRNDFLHQGISIDLNKEIMESCFQHTFALEFLFLQLHNEYVAGL